jgi:hypothetical protein
VSIATPIARFVRDLWPQVATVPSVLLLSTTSTILMLVWTLARYLIFQQKPQLKFVQLVSTAAMYALAQLKINARVV